LFYFPVFQTFFQSYLGESLKHIFPISTTFGYKALMGK